MQLIMETNQLGYKMAGFTQAGLLDWDQKEGMMFQCTEYLQSTTSIKRGIAVQVNRPEGSLPYVYLSFFKPEKGIRQVWKDSEAMWTVPTFFSISYDDRE